MALSRLRLILSSEWGQSLPRARRDRPPLTEAQSPSGGDGKSKTALQQKLGCE
jgi:hypothetical protein